MSATVKRSTVCDKAITGGTCKRLPAHNGECRLALTRRALRALLRKGTAPHQAQHRHSTKPATEKQLAARAKFTQMARDKAAIRAAAKLMAQARVVAAPKGRVKVKAYRTSGRPVLARPSVG